MDKIFASFEKLRNKPTAGEKSTGLGMAIVKKLSMPTKEKLKFTVKLARALSSGFLCSVPRGV